MRSGRGWAPDAGLGAQRSTRTHLVTEMLDVRLGELLALAQVGDPLVLLADSDHTGKR